MNFRLLNPLRRLARSNRSGRAVVTPRRIYILPTGYGILFAILLLLMLLGSINYANNLGFLLTFLLVGLGLVTMLHTWRNLVGLALNSGRATPVFAGEDAYFEIQLINQRRWSRPGIQLQIPPKTWCSPHRAIAAADCHCLGSPSPAVIPWVFSTPGST